MAARTAVIERKTNETEIRVAINLDCQPGSANKQELSISTGIGFLDHVSPSLMVALSLGAHANRRLDVSCIGEALRHVAAAVVQG